MNTLDHNLPNIFQNNSIQTNWQITSNIHYMISGTRNFVGLGFNKEINYNDFDLTIRPQMRVEIRDNLLIGIVIEIPLKREYQQFSFFYDSFTNLPNIKKILF